MEISQDQSIQNWNPDLIWVEEGVAAALREIIRAVDIHSRQLLAGCGLTGPQLAVLRGVARLGPISATGLARSVHLGQPTVTGILDRLEARGLIERSADARDRRKVTLRATEAGLAVVRSAPGAMPRALAEGLARMEPWERLAVLSSLQRLASMTRVGGVGLSEASGASGAVALPAAGNAAGGTTSSLELTGGTTL